MKKLKEFGEALVFISCVILDCIIYPVQRLFGWNIFQVTQYYIEYLIKLKND